MPNLVQTREGGVVNTDLDRASFEVTGDISKVLRKSIRFVSFELAKRNIERNRPYVLTIGLTENLLNNAELNALAQHDYVPETLALTTLDAKGNVASRRVFANLQFQLSTNGYATFAGHEVPVIKLVYDCVLCESEFRQVRV